MMKNDVYTVFTMREKDRVQVRAVKPENKIQSTIFIRDANKLDPTVEKKNTKDD